MVVTAKRDICTSSDQAIELLANYGLPYWFAFAVRNHLSLGHDSVLVKGVFWLLFSTFSCMPTRERAMSGVDHVSVLVKDIFGYFWLVYVATLF